MILVNTIFHPKSSKGKFVYRYKTERGNVYYSEDDEVVYFDTPEEARETCGNRPCWSISEILNPAGDINEVRKYLESKGWETWYNEDNWIKREWLEPDAKIDNAGMSTIDAYNLEKHDKMKGITRTRYTTKMKFDPVKPKSPDDRKN